MVFQVVLTTAGILAGVHREREQRVDIVETALGVLEKFSVFNEVRHGDHVNSIP